MTSDYRDTDNGKKIDTKHTGDLAHKEQLYIKNILSFLYQDIYHYSDIAISSIAVRIAQPEITLCSIEIISYGISCLATY